MTKSKRQVFVVGEHVMVNKWEGWTEATVTKPETVKSWHNSPCVEVDVLSDRPAGHYHTSFSNRRTSILKMDEFNATIKSVLDRKAAETQAQESERMRRLLWYADQLLAAAGVSGFAVEVARNLDEWFHETGTARLAYDRAHPKEAPSA